jgi:hypothetical protein
LGPGNGCRRTLSPISILSISIISHSGKWLQQPESEKLFPYFCHLSSRPHIKWGTWHGRCRISSQTVVPICDTYLDTSLAWWLLGFLIPLASLHF